ncbi:GNAT family N-acetyltransferase [Neobacillus mesonae]|nr:GNAT family N-acetyltransferase [Neobacillus mesonae]
MEKLSFVKFQDNNFKDYYQLVRDIKVMAQITERAIPLEEAQINFHNLLKRNSEHDVFGTYRAVIGETFIGLGHLTLNKADNTEAEMGYMLLPAYWGQGFGSVIANHMLELGKRTNITKVKAIIDPANIASRKILIHHHFVSEEVCEIDGLPGEILSRIL